MSVIIGVEWWTVCLGYIKYAVHSYIVGLLPAIWVHDMAAHHQGGRLGSNACLSCATLSSFKSYFSAKKEEKMQRIVQPLQYVMECVKSLWVLRKVLTVIRLYWSIVAGTFGLDLDSLSSINKIHFKSRLQTTAALKRVFLLWVMP